MKQLSYFILLTLFIVTTQTHLQAQTTLVAGQTIIDPATGIDDYIIPSGLSSITFSLRGADGGFIRVDGSACDWVGDANGGSGATVEATYPIGGTSDFLEAGGSLRVYLASYTQSYSLSCFGIGIGGLYFAPGGGASAILYLPPGADPNGQNWYILAVAGGGGGGIIDSYTVRKGRGANASEFGDTGTTQTVTLGDCGPSELISGFDGLDGYGGAGYKCLNPLFVAEGAGQNMLTSFVEELPGLIRVAVKDNSFFSQTGTDNPGGPPELGSSDGFCGGGYAIFEPEEFGDRGAGGGGGGFTGGAATNYLSGGGGGSFVALGFISTSTRKIDGADGAGGLEELTLRGGELILTANAAIAPTAVCKDTLLTVDINGNIPTLTPSMVDGGSTLGTGTILTLSFLEDSLEVNQLNFNCNSGVPPARTVTLLAKDETGLTSTCTALITFQDTFPPIAVCKSMVDTIFLNNGGNSSLAPGDVDNGSSDNCGFILSLDKTSFNCSDIGMQTLKFFATDLAGNKDSCTIDVVVADTIPPMPLVTQTYNFICSGTVFGSPTAEDNCAGLLQATNDMPMTFNTIGTFTIDWIYEDGNGNTGIITETVNVTADTVIYVDKDAAPDGDGSSWTEAFQDVDLALDFINNANCSGAFPEIWVADGTYQPVDQVPDSPQTTNNTRTKVFYLDKSGVKLYGGFEGLSGAQETSRDQRNPDVNITILDGDIGVQGNNVDNVYRIFYIDTPTNTTTEPTVIDGFTIQNGNADGSDGSIRAGGAIYINTSTANAPTIEINGCRFITNSAGTGIGGAIYINSATLNNPNVEIDSCSFSQNSAGSGGAIYNDNVAGFSSSLIITHSEFSNNTASEPLGGGTVGFGGAIYNDINFGLNRAIIDKCVFSNNTAATAGGAIYNNGIDGNDGAPTFTNCRFFLNTAPSGGAVYLNENEIESDPPLNDAAQAKFVNCSFENNGANHIGYDDGQADSEPEFINCTFFGATTRAIDVDAFDTDVVPMFFKNCIFWNNTDLINTAAAMNVQFSIVGDDNGNNFAGSNNNINQDPLFVDVVGNGLNLSICSPAIDAGDNTAIDTFSTDLPGNTRIINGIVDMGSNERQDLTLPDLLGIISIQASDSLFTGADTIRSFGTVTVAAMDTIIFEGAKAVVLKAGFSAVAGSNFTARIGQCGVPASNSMFSSEVIEERSKPSEVKIENTNHQILIEKQNSLTAYPNPFKETTTIEFELETTSSVQLSVFDLQGRMITSFYQGAWLNAGLYQVQIDAQDWEAGMYVIRLATVERVMTNQLILQR